MSAAGVHDIAPDQLAGLMMKHFLQIQKDTGLPVWLERVSAGRYRLHVGYRAEGEK